MTLDDFRNLKDGDKVHFIVDHDLWNFKYGEIITRKVDWLDCDISSKFVNENGVTDYLSYIDVEAIKEKE